MVGSPLSSLSPRKGWLVVHVLPRMRQLKGRDLQEMMQSGLADLRIEERIRKTVTQGLPAVLQV